MTEKVSIQIYNWGPCVVRMKISDDFKKLLLDEGNKNKTDYTTKLAGILDKEIGYNDESKSKIVLSSSSHGCTLANISSPETNFNTA